MKSKSNIMTSSKALASVILIFGLVTRVARGSVNKTGDPVDDAKAKTVR